MLKNIGRRNISTDMFKDLMKKYNDLGIATFSELILGLPGETYDSFCSGVNTLIENGQHFAINIYSCEILPNAEMGQKSYQEKFGIKSTRVPFKLIHSNNIETNDNITEYSEYITSTSSMCENDWVNSLLFSVYVQALHNLGLLRAIAVYMRHEHNLNYSDFYNRLIELSKNPDNKTLNKVYSRIHSLCSGIIKGDNALVSTCEGTGNMLWGFDEVIFLEFYKNLTDFYNEVHKCFEGFTESNKLNSLFGYQQDIIKKIGTEDVSITNDYNFYSYYLKIFSGNYEPLKKEKITINIHDASPVNTFEDFAREVVWYGRNRRATDYTGNGYSIEIK